MVVRFLVFFTVLIIIETVSVLGVPAEGLNWGVLSRKEQVAAIMEKYASPDPYAVMMSRYKIMLLSILGLWAFVLGLRWAVTGKLRLWEKKE
jgi:hypothetical protein